MDNLEPPSMGEILDIVERRRSEAQRRNRAAFAGVAVILIAAGGITLRSLALNDTDETATTDEPTTLTTATTGRQQPAPSEDPTTVPETQQSVATPATDTTTSTLPTTTSAPTSSPTTPEPDPATLLLDFADTWRRGDWASMAELAVPAVVGTAQQWYTEGDVGPLVDADNITGVLDSCFETAPQTTRCEILYAPGTPNAPGPAGLIFAITYTDDGTGRLTVTALDFGGDAG